MCRFNGSHCLCADMDIDGVEVCMCCEFKVCVFVSVCVCMLDVLCKTASWSSLLAPPLPHLHCPYGVQGSRATVLVLDFHREVGMSLATLKLAAPKKGMRYTHTRTHTRMHTHKTHAHTHTHTHTHTHIHTHRSFSIHSALLICTNV